MIKMSDDEVIHGRHDDLAITFNHDVDDSEGDDLEGSDIKMDTEDKGSENAPLAEERFLIHE